MSEALQRLSTVVEQIGPLAVAVSGGVDSTTLSVVAGRVLGANALMIHAVSPAVPADATARVRRYAERYDWSLSIIDAGEFADPRYRANPVNRCFFCKTHLYSAMADRVEVPLVSGTNLDDLGDFRPGLEAAAARGVRHPYVDAEIDKATVRAIAKHLALEDLAELPASPCLSSRVETGLRIEARTLGVIDEVERWLRETLTPHTARLRIRHDGAVIELDRATVEGLKPAARAEVSEAVRVRLAEAGVERAVRLEVYRMGSAFLRTGHES